MKRNQHAKEYQMSLQIHIKCQPSEYLIIECINYTIISYSSHDIVLEKLFRFILSLSPYYIKLKKIVSQDRYHSISRTSPHSEAIIG